MTDLTQPVLGLLIEDVIDGNAALEGLPLAGEDAVQRIGAICRVDRARS